MDFEQAEGRLDELKTGLELGELDEATFRVEVAKLLFRDERGIFWMLDPDEGTWFCNRGEGWAASDPRAERAAEGPPPDGRRNRSRRLAWALGAAVVVLIGVAGFLVWQQWLAPLWNAQQLAAGDSSRVRVTIASPATGSQAAVGQEIAIESTIAAAGGLEAVGRVSLVVNGETVDSQPVQPKIQSGQTTLPLSQSWLPSAPGEYQVAVIAFSAGGEPLGVAAIHVEAQDAPNQVVPEPSCVPGATFVTDVTIPHNTAFPPGVRMEKVWQMRNSGSCAWGVGYELVLVDGEGLGAPNAVPVPPTAAGEPADLTVTFWAPEEPGSYSSIWQLQSPSGLFFGPQLSLDIQVEALAKETSPPAAPTDVQAMITQGGKAVRLTWVDQSDNEDAFRIYREDIEASIGLAPADAEMFVDDSASCSRTYRYAVVAFNAAGPSPASTTDDVSLPACAPVDEAPSMVMTIVPTQIVASETFTVAFVAEDDLGLSEIMIRGQETGDPVLDEGRVFACGEGTCAGIWPVTFEPTPSGQIETQTVSMTLTLVGIATDTSGQESGPAWMEVTVLPPE